MERVFPPLSAVRAFEAVARHRSIRQGALALHVSHTVVSRHVRNLEEWLGVQLLDRTQRGITLTDTGERYFRGITDSLDRIASATAEVRNVRAPTALRIWCPPALTRYWLLPRLNDLQSLLPGTEISLRPTPAIPDLDGGEADVHICWERSSGFDGSGELLVRPAIFPVVSGALARRYAAVRKPADLLGKPLLHEDSPLQWRDWLLAAGLKQVPPLAGTCLWSGDAPIEAATLGQGIALTNELIAHADLASGRQVRLLDLDVRMYGYFLRMRQGVAVSASGAKLRNWLFDSVRQTLRGGGAS
jgi:DNA-binding transcriptional LysR family regulator